MTSDPDADEGPDADPESVARRILLDQLTGRARSRHELAVKLASRGVPEEIASTLLDRFTEVGLIDDAAFAAAWVESRSAGKHLGRRSLSQELRRKGIPDTIAREALQRLEPDDEDAAARAFVRRKVASLRGVDRATATRRLVGALARKGHEPGRAYRIVREELAAARDGEPEDSAVDWSTMHP